MYLVLAIESMSGPTWPPSCPAVRMEAASSTSASSPSSDGPCSSPPSTRISTEAAMHLWPQQPAKDATMSLAAILKSQSCRAIRWFFAPPRAKTLEYHKRKTIKTTPSACPKWNEMKWNENPFVKRVASVRNNLSDFGWSHEGNRSNIRVVTNSCDDVCNSMDDLKDSLGNAGFHHQFHDAHHGQRDLLRGLQYYAVTHGQGNRNRPHGNHCWQIRVRLVEGLGPNAFQY